MSALWKLVCAISLLSLAHCAYSAAQHRSYLRLAAQPFTGLPADITIQTLVSLLFAIYACSVIAGDFQQIRTDQKTQKKSWDLIGDRLNFYNFDHRAKCFSPNFSSSAESQSSINEHLKYCAGIVEQRDYESYLAARLLPFQKQERVFPILALNAEVSVVRQKILRNSGVTGIYQLQFWKDAMNTLVGQMRGPIPRQPVVKALEYFNIVSNENVTLFHKLISARQETLGDRPFVSVDKLEENSRLVHGTLIQLVAQQLSNTLVRSNELQDAANDLGVAVGITTLLRATVPLLKEGVVLLPIDLISLHGLSPDSFFRGDFPEGLKGVAKDLCKIAEHRAKKARNKLTQIDIECRPAFLSAGMRVDHVLGCLQKSNYNILSSSLQQPPNFVASKLWWRYKRKRF
ncbi:hypothetical protein M3Y97_00519600 [Aphelenchoides bicaudatus]|nr:hypothetical protein M3Y97_00519600 [Aphelenchoides bicaudatus]